MNKNTETQEVNLKDLIKEYYIQEGYGEPPEDNESLYEIFEECSDTVQIGEPDHHRWYTLYNVVRKFTVKGKEYYFDDKIMSVDGDNSRSDCGWEAPDVGEMIQLFPKEVLKVIYVTKEKL